MLRYALRQHHTARIFWPVFWLHMRPTYQSTPQWTDHGERLDVSTHTYDIRKAFADFRQPCNSLQERTLSPRSIYFDQQLIWECSELLANESFPEGSPGQHLHLHNELERKRPLRLTDLLHDIQAPPTKYAGGLTIPDIYRVWIYLVETYRHCNLTYTSETLPALASLASSFQVELGDEYVAGL